MFFAVGENGSVFTVRKSGRSIYISDPDGKTHLCHPSVHGDTLIKNEIFLVFHERIIDIKYPGDI